MDEKMKLKLNSLNFQQNLSMMDMDNPPKRPLSSSSSSSSSSSVAGDDVICKTNEKPSHETVSPNNYSYPGNDNDDNDEIWNIDMNRIRRTSSSSSYFSLDSSNNGTNNNSSTSSSSSSCDTCSINPSQTDIGFINHHFYRFPENEKTTKTNFPKSIAISNDTTISSNTVDMFQKIRSFLSYSTQDLDIDLISNAMRTEDVDNPEKFLTSANISKYFCLLQQMCQSDIDNDDVRIRLENFCRNILIQEPCIMSMFLPQLWYLSRRDTNEQLNSYVMLSNFYFSTVIQTHLLYTDVNNVEIPIPEDELIRVVEWLYPDHQLYQLFDFIETAREVGQEGLSSIMDIKDFVDVKTISKAFYGTRMFLLPILEKIFIQLLLPATSRSRNDRVNKSLMVFCLRSTIFEQALYHFEQWLDQYHGTDGSSSGGRAVEGDQSSNKKKKWFARSGDGDDDDDDDGTTVGENENQQKRSNGHPISSVYLVQHLYQWAINLALVAASFDRPDILNQFLRIRIPDLDFESSLNEVLKLIGMEFEKFNDGFARDFHGFQEIFNGGGEGNNFDFENIFIDLGNENENSSDDDDGAGRNSKQINRRRTITVQQKRDLLEKIKMQGEAIVAPVNNRWNFDECTVCLQSTWLLVRSCCGFGACLECLTRYYTDRIKMGNIVIECIGPNCKELVYRTEVNVRLSNENKALYGRMLLCHSNESERSRPCPRCNKILTLSSEDQTKMKRANKRLLVKRMFKLGFTQTIVEQSKTFKVKCEACEYDWCFKCHSPWHEGLSCKDYVKGDRLLKSWAKLNPFTGDVNARKCPRCKIYIQRISGCDHMQCSHCKTDFCYRCGDRLRHFRFFGDHYSRLSILGCKYRYKPENPVQRKLVRGAVLGSKLAVLPVLTTVCLCTGALVLAVGVAAIPFVGGFYFYNRIRNQRAPGYSSNVRIHLYEQDGRRLRGRFDEQLNIEALRISRSTTTDDNQDDDHSVDIPSIGSYNICLENDKSIEA